MLMSEDCSLSLFFTALALSANPDVLAVSESWLRKATKNSEISIPNYNIFRQHWAGGGSNSALPMLSDDVVVGDGVLCIFVGLG